MATHVRCGSLFTGDQAAPSTGGYPRLRRQRAAHLRRPDSGCPAGRRRRDGAELSTLFVMPGLLDVHTHLAYGNAKTEEDIDLYQPMEFRALRGLFFAQKVRRGRLHVDLRAGRCRADQPLGAQRHQRRPVRRPARHRRRPLPHHAAGPDRLVSDLDRRARTSIGRLVTSRDEAIEEIRVQAKNGVDCIKIAIDGIQRRPDGELIAAFTAGRDDAHGAARSHRLGKKAVVACARPRGDALRGARRRRPDLPRLLSRRRMHRRDARIGQRDRPDADLPAQHHRFHAAARAGGASRAASTTRSANTRSPARNLRKARKAGVPMMTGTDSGFAVTPYGEWHARELEIFVERSRLHAGRGAARAPLGDRAASWPTASRSACSRPAAPPTSSRSTARRCENIAILQDKSRIRARPYRRQAHADS